MLFCSVWSEHVMYFFLLSCVLSKHNHFYSCVNIHVHLGPNITGRRVGPWSSPAVFISWLAAQWWWRWFMLVTAWLLQSSHRELLLARLQPGPETWLDAQDGSRISCLWTCIQKADELFVSACLCAHLLIPTSNYWGIISTFSCDQLLFFRVCWNKIKDSNVILW